MIEVLWHGRGGQGAFTAARLLGAAASHKEGKYALAFPSFGPERRGAPMRAFTKIDDAPIGNRSAISQADFVVYLDDTLLGDAFADDLKPNATVLVNSKTVYADSRVIALDADGISTAILGRPIPNTVFLGAIAALSDAVQIEDAKEAVRLYMPPKLHAKNEAIIDAAVTQVELHKGHVIGSEQKADQEDSGCLPSCCAERARQAEGLPVLESRASQVFAAREFGAVHIPTLRTDELNPDNFAHTTCFEAGYLVAKNAGWRNMRPVIDVAACTGCLQCYMLCPDGAVFKVPTACQPPEPLDAAACVPTAYQPPEPLDAAASCGTQSCRAGDNLRTEVRGVDAITPILGTTETLADLGGPGGQELQPGGQRGALGYRAEVVVAFDYDFCKGCAICKKACPVDAISMISEKEALA